jgi:hypothetical protein
MEVVQVHRPVRTVSWCNLNVWRGNESYPGWQAYKNCFLMPRKGGGLLNSLTLKNSILMHPMEDMRRLGWVHWHWKLFPEALYEGHVDCRGWLGWNTDLGELFGGNVKVGQVYWPWRTVSWCPLWRVPWPWRILSWCIQWRKWGG